MVDSDNKDYTDALYSVYFVKYLNPRCQECVQFYVNTVS